MSTNKKIEEYYKHYEYYTFNCNFIYNKDNEIEIENSDDNIKNLGYWIQEICNIDNIKLITEKVYTFEIIFGLFVISNIVDDYFLKYINIRNHEKCHDIIVGIGKILLPDKFPTSMIENK